MHELPEENIGNGTPNNQEKKEEKQRLKFEPFAKRFMQSLTDNQTKLVCWNGIDYFFNETRYVADNLETHLRKWMLKNEIAQSNALVSNVMPVVRTLCHASAVLYPQMPFWTGAEDDCPNVIAYKNGRLDVGAFLKGKVLLLPHSLHWVSTFCLPYDFNADAKCERWLKFLDEVFGGDDRIKLLQQWLGYCLLPHNKKQVCIHFQGPPASGKSTIGEVLRQLVGTENATGYSLDSLAREHGTAILLNKMVAICGETNLSGHPQKRRIMERFTSIVGGDAVAVNPKYMAETSARLPVKFAVLSNEDVIFADHAGAMARRLLCLPFDKSFANRADDTLPEQLAGEIEGIAQWALQGLLSLEKEGKFHEPERTKEKKQEQRRSNSDVYGFLQDCCKVHRSCDPGNLDGIIITDEEGTSVTRECLQNALKLWWSEEGKDDMHCPTVATLGIHLRSMLPMLRNVQRRTITGRERCYVGIGLLEPDTGKTRSVVELLEAVMKQN